MSTTLRVSDETRQRVAQLAAASGRKMQTIVDEAVLAYERAVFWDAFDEGYQRLADDPEAWADIQAERAAEAPAIRDSLE